MSAQRGTAAAGTSGANTAADSSTAATTAAAAGGGAQSTDVKGSATANDAAIDGSTNGAAKKRKMKKGAGESLHMYKDAYVYTYYVTILLCILCICIIVHIKRWQIDLQQESQDKC